MDGVMSKKKLTPAEQAKAAAKKAAHTKQRALQGIADARRKRLLAEAKAEAKAKAKAIREAKKAQKQAQRKAARAAAQAERRSQAKQRRNEQARARYAAKKQGKGGK